MPRHKPIKGGEKNKQPVFLNWKIFFLCWTVFQVYKFELWSKFAVSVHILNKELACSLHPCFIQTNRGCDKQHFLEKQLCGVDPSWMPGAHPAALSLPSPAGQAGKV